MILTFLDDLKDHRRAQGRRHELKFIIQDIDPQEIETAFNNRLNRLSEIFRYLVAPLLS